jgi:UDP-GlcNAc:undecaprenyl-phosphate GlcNAc-1-phosphate transferase
MNSLNLLDGIDGLATTVGIVLSLTIAVLAMLTEHYLEALVIASLAGSLCGFLKFNLPPAKMFLGDAGSMLIGLMIGALAIRSTLKGPATVALAAPFAMLTIPIFDSTAAILRRKLTGRSIYATDRGHLHHRLLARSGSTPRTLASIGLCCGLTSLGAIVGLWFRNDLIALVTSFCVIGVLIATRVFGHVELLLLTDSLNKISRNLLGVFGFRKTSEQQTSIRLQGTQPWDLLWNSLVEFTDKFNLHTIRLDVNIPALHEAYHASWASPVKCDSSKLWRTEVPLFADDQILGRLTITGERDAMSVCEVIDRLMDFLCPFEARLQEIVAQRVGATPLTASTAVPHTRERAVLAPTVMPTPPGVMPVTSGVPSWDISKAPTRS